MVTGVETCKGRVCGKTRRVGMKVKYGYCRSAGVALPTCVSVFTCECRGRGVSS